MFSRVSRRIVLSVVATSAISVVIVACGLSVDGSSESGTAPTNDAGGVSPDGAPSNNSGDGGEGLPLSGGDSGALTDGGNPLDGSSKPDASIGSGCVPIIDDTFTGQEANWDRLGSALFLAGHVALTQKNAGSQAGAIWWKPAITFNGVLKVTIDIAIDAQGVTPADGIGIAWVAAPYSLGMAGQNFGLCNASMNGVSVAGDSLDGKLLVMDGIASNCQTNNGVFPANVVGASWIAAEIRADSITGQLDTSTAHTRNLTISKTGHLGIAASTGNGFASHAVMAIRAFSCP